MSTIPEQDPRGFYKIHCLECKELIFATHRDTKFCTNNNRVCEKRYTNRQKQKERKALMQKAKTVEEYKSKLKPSDFKETNIKRLFRDINDSRSHLDKIEFFTFELIALNKELKKAKKKSTEELQELEQAKAEAAGYLLFYSNLLRNESNRIDDNVLDYQVWKDKFIEKIMDEFDTIEDGKIIFPFENPGDRDNDGGELIES